MEQLDKKKGNDMQLEIAYQVFEQKEAKRKRIRLAEELQRQTIARSIFPCMHDIIPTVESDYPSKKKRFSR